MTTSKKNEIMKFINKVNGSQMDEAKKVLDKSFEVNRRVVAAVPIELLKVDTTYQRDKQNHLSKLIAQWDNEKYDFLRVNLRKDGFFWVSDGQHRYLAARENDEKDIICILDSGLNMKQEANEFASQGELTKKLTCYDIYKANVAAGKPVDKLIHAICEYHHVSVSSKTSSTNLSCLSGVKRLLTAKDGEGNCIVNEVYEDCFKVVMDIVKLCGWYGKYEKAYCYDIVVNMTNILRSEIETIGTLKTKAIEVLSKTSPYELSMYASIIYASVSGSEHTRVKCFLYDLLHDKYDICELRERYKAIA